MLLCPPRAYPGFRPNSSELIATRHREYSSPKLQNVFDIAGLFRSLDEQQEQAPLIAAYEELLEELSCSAFEDVEHSSMLGDLRRDQR